MIIIDYDVTSPILKFDAMGTPSNSLTSSNKSEPLDHFLMNLIKCSIFLQAHSYMLDCALEGSRLCQLTMANKHLHGIDGIPVDQEQVYGKFHHLFSQGKLFAE